MLTTPSLMVILDITKSLLLVRAKKKQHLPVRLVFAYRRISIGLCNAHATFQRCMLSIFSDMVERFLEVFMDDFSVFRSNFDEGLYHLSLALIRCKENLVLNWEKCHFMVKSEIILRHIVFKKGIEVDKAKIELISKLPPPKTVREV